MGKESLQNYCIVSTNVNYKDMVDGTSNIVAQLCPF